MSSLAHVFNRVSQNAAPSAAGVLNKENKELPGSPQRKSFTRPKPPLRIGILPSAPDIPPQPQSGPQHQDIGLMSPVKVRKRTAEERDKKDIGLLKPAQVRRRKRGGAGGSGGGPGGA